jgi:PAS domain S-box-containing protein
MKEGSRLHGPSPSPSSLELRIPLEPARLARVRERVRDYLREHCGRAEVIDDIVVSLEEACTNAIQHSGAKDDLQVGLRFDGDVLAVTVVDRGRGIDPSAYQPDRIPDLDATGGRGLFLIGRLMDEIELQNNGGTRVHMRKRTGVLSVEERHRRFVGEMAAGSTLALGELEDRMLDTLETMTDGFVAIDWEWRYLYANAAALELLRHSAEELIGRRVWDLFPAAVGTEFEEQYRLAMEQGIARHFEFYFPVHETWYELRVYPTSSGISVYFGDINERKRIEMERDALLHEVAEGRSQLEAVLESMTEGVVISTADAHLVQMNTEALRLHRFKCVQEVQRGIREFPEFELRDLDGGIVPVEDWPLSRLSRGEQLRDLTLNVKNVETGDSSIWSYSGAPVLGDDGAMRLSVLTIRDVTVEHLAEQERRRIEQDLAESERRFRATFEQAAVGIAHVDLDGRFVRVNKRYCELTGYSDEELQALTFPEITHPDDIDADVEQAKDLLEGRIDTYTMDKRYVRKDGRPLWISLTGSMVRSDDGEPDYFVAVVKDIDDRKAAEAALRRSRETLEHAAARSTLLADVTAAAVGQKGVERVADEALVSAALHLGLVSGSVYLLDDEETSLRRTGRFGPPIEGVDADELPVDETSPLGRMVLHRHPCLIHDGGEPHCGDDGGDGQKGGRGRWIALTMPVGTKVLGVLLLAFEQHRPFEPFEIALYRAVADQLAIVLQRSTFEEQRERQSRLLEKTIMSSGIGMAVLDGDARIRLVNDEALLIAGRSREELTGQPFFAVFPELESRAADFARVLRGEESVEVGEMPYEDERRPDLGTRFFDWTLTGVRGEEGGIDYVLLSVIDVSERVEQVRLDKALNDSNDVARTASDPFELVTDVTAVASVVLESDALTVLRLTEQGWTPFLLSGPDEASLQERRFAADEAPFAEHVRRRGETVALEDADGFYETQGRAGAVRFASALGAPLVSGGTLLGVLLFGWKQRRAFSEHDVEFVTRLGALLGSSLENLQLFMELVERERFAQSLNEINARLASTRERQIVYDEVLSLAARSLECGSSSVALRGEDGWVPVAVWNLPREFVGHLLSPVTVPYAEKAVADLRPVALFDLAGDPLGNEELAGQYGVTSNLTVPLVVRGRPTGGLFFNWHQTRHRPTARELEFAEQVASALSQALEGTRLYEELSERATLEAALNDMDSVIHSTLDATQVVQFALSEGARGLAVDSATVEVAEGADWIVQYECGLDPSVVGRRLTRDEAPIAARCVRRQRPVVVEDLGASREFDHHFLRTYSRTSVLAVPLLLREKAHGSLLFHTVERVRFSDAQVDFARRLATSVSLALDNARLFEAQRRIATTLQENMIRPLPRVAGLELAELSLPAHDPELVGGDFSDVFMLDDGKVALLIADVMGKGIKAAGMTETVRSAVRALALVEAKPAAVLTNVGRMLRSQASEQFVTLLLMVLDVYARRAVVASAGHPGPVVLGRDGARHIELPGGPPLGSFVWQYTEQVLSLEDVHGLVLFTDGLVEARRDGELYGNERVLAVLGDLGDAAPAEIIEELRHDVTEFAEHLGDDLQLLALRLPARERAPETD